MPILFEGIFNTIAIETTLNILQVEGSKASPLFKRPEGIVIWHKAGQIYFKKTIEKDDEYKGKVK